MKISDNVIEQYMELCPLSSEKCDQYSEIKYKIQRAVDLGKVIYTIDGESHVQYYCNCFVVKGDKVIRMYKNRDEYYHISKKSKNTYDEINDKVLI